MTSSLKITVITVTYNSASYLDCCIQSVLMQKYDNIEYIIVDGASKDATVDIIKSYGSRIARYVSEPDKGLYDAINKGIGLASGDVIGILNSDDFFPTPDVITTIAATFMASSVDAIYGDVAFVRPGREDRIIRQYSSKRFKPYKFRLGYMPAHPSFYAKKELFASYGMYKLGYKIAADYELLMRFMHQKQISYTYVNKNFVYMRTGGVSNSSLKNRYLLNKETVRACRENGVYTNIVILSLKYFTKIFEFIMPAFKSR